MSSFHTRRIILPSGKAVDIIYYQPDEISSVSEAVQPASTVEHLEVCPACDSHLVQPVAWSEAADEQWEIHLRCPSCDEERTGVWPRDVVERFDVALNHASDQVIDDIQRISADRMEAWAQTFTAALQAGAIFPDDF